MKTKIAIIALVLIGLISCKKEESKPAAAVPTQQTQVNNKNYWTLYIKYAIPRLLNQTAKTQATLILSAYADTLVNMNSKLLFKKDTVYDIPFINTQYEMSHRIPRTTKGLVFGLIPTNYNEITWYVTLDTTLKQTGPVLNYSNLYPQGAHILKFK